LRTLPAVEGYCLPLTKLVERPLAARRLMKEVFAAVVGGNEPETLFADQSFDRALHRCHLIVSLGIFLFHHSRVRGVPSTSLARAGGGRASVCEQCEIWRDRRSVVTSVPLDYPTGTTSRASGTSGAGSVRF